MFSSSFTMSEQKHRQWTPYKHDAPDTVECVKRYFKTRASMPWRLLFIT